jgi:hypothetical protein
VNIVRGLFLWNHVVAPRASMFIFWAIFQAEHGGCNPALDAVTYQASFPD